MTDLDVETRAAVSALVYRLRNRGDEQGQFATDDELFASEYLTVMKSRGWRPVLALPAEADWRKASGGSRTPDAGRPGGEAYLAAKAAIANRVTGGQPVLTEHDDNRETA